MVGRPTVVQAFPSPSIHLLLSEHTVYRHLPNHIDGSDQCIRHSDSLRPEVAPLRTASIWGTVLGPMLRVGIPCPCRALSSRFRSTTASEKAREGSAEGLRETSDDGRSSSASISRLQHPQTLRHSRFSPTWRHTSSSFERPNTATLRRHAGSDGFRWRRHGSHAHYSGCVRLLCCRDSSFNGCRHPPSERSRGNPALSEARRAQKGRGRARVRSGERVATGGQCHGSILVLVLPHNDDDWNDHDTYCHSTLSPIVVSCSTPQTLETITKTYQTDVLASTATFVRSTLIVHG